MENTKLENYKALVETYATDTVNILRKYGKEAVGEKLSSFVGQRLHDFRPSIMFYGIYNAGKSTILNSMMGKEVAKMDDVPTTYQVDQYEWNGYYLYDTPGIDAPKKHEEVSKEHLSRCDVVLFVMSTNGTFESGKNYEEMASIIHTGKPLIIVLNNKSGWDENNESDRQQLSSIREKVLENLQTVCARYGITQAVENRYKVVVVNGRRALQGRLKNSSQFIEKSGIRDLEREILLDMKSVGGLEIVRTLARAIDDHLKSLQGELYERKASNEEQLATSVLQEVLQQKEQVRSSLRRTIRNLAVRTELDMFQAAQDAGEEADAAVRKVLDSFTSQVEEEYQKEMKQAQENLQRNLAKLPLEQLAPEASLDPVAHKAVSQLAGPNGLPDYVEGQSEESYTVKSTMPNLADISLNMVAGKEIEKVVTNMVVKELPKLLVSSGLKKAAFAPIITAVTPWIGPVILVGSVLFSILGGKSSSEADMEERIRRQNQENERARQQAIAMAAYKQELASNCKKIMCETSEMILKQIEDAISEVFASLEKTIEELTAAKGKERLELMGELKDIDTLRNELSVLGSDAS